MTMRLDDVAKRIDSICNDYTAAVSRAKTKFDADIDTFRKDLDASDLQVGDVSFLVFGRVNRLISEIDTLVTTQ